MNGKNGKIGVAAVMLLCTIMGRSYVQAEGIPHEESTIADSIDYAGENSEQMQASERAIYEDDIVTVYTEGYLYSAGDECTVTESMGNLLHMKILVDGKLTAEQTFDYQTSPGKLEVKPEEMYEIENILLNEEAFENGETVVYGEVTEQQLEIHLYTKASLIIHYQDTQGNTIAQDVVIEGKTGENVSWKNPIIEEYEVEDAIEQKVLEFPGIQEITVLYARKEAETENRDSAQSQELTISVYLE